MSPTLCLRWEAARASPYLHLSAAGLHDFLSLNTENILFTCGLFSWFPYGASFPIDSLPFGAVNRTVPHRRIFLFLKTAPHRTVDLTISEIRTEPDRRTFSSTERHRKAHGIYLKTAPNRTVVLTISKNHIEPHRTSSHFSKPHPSEPLDISQHRTAS